MLLTTFIVSLTSSVVANVFYLLFVNAYKYKIEQLDNAIVELMDDINGLVNEIESIRGDVDQLRNELDEMREEEVEEEDESEEEEEEDEKEDRSPEEEYAANIQMIHPCIVPIVAFLISVSTSAWTYLFLQSPLLSNK
jgi:predicted  nucleic acid-binding Zn-ribbon protein